MTAYNEWMVKSNLQRITDGADPKKIVKVLRYNGYEKVADEVEKRSIK